MQHEHGGLFGRQHGAFGRLNPEAGPEYAHVVCSCSFHPGRMPPASDLAGILTFLRRAERLKHTLRSAHLSTGRRESVGEHTWRLALMALVVAPHYPDIDTERLLKMCLVHDLGEALQGDIPAPEQAGAPDKAAQERADLMTLLDDLPAAHRDDIAALWDEYEAATTPEAKLAKALDKLETILQHNQGQQPGDFDYAFNLDYGTDYTSGDPLIERLRAILDAETAQHTRSKL